MIRSVSTSPILIIIIPLICFSLSLLYFIFFLFSLLCFKCCSSSKLSSSFFQFLLIQSLDIYRYPFLHFKSSIFTFCFHYFKHFVVNLLKMKSLLFHEGVGSSSWLWFIHLTSWLDCLLNFINICDLIISFKIIKAAQVRW